MVKKFAVLTLWLMFTYGICSAQTVVVLKKGRVQRYDARTGAYKGTVGPPGAMAASSDGETIAIVCRDGHVKRYAANGAYKGQVGSGHATDVQVSSGVIIITYKNGKIVRYDARTGAYKGGL